jgi:Na+-driven multidrug efflux pump
MTTIFTHVPHPRLEQREREGPVKVGDQMPRGHPLARLNTRLGLAITVAVGSMWCAYLFTALAFVSFPSAIKTHNKIVIVGWIAQTFLQLVLLPIIIVGQNVQAAASDKRAEQTYKDAEAVLQTAMQIQDHLLAQDAELEKILRTIGATQ